jgi:CRISPR-associated protein Cas5d
MKNKRYNPSIFTFVKVKGDRALFTNPSMGVTERYTYLSLPPSAARGIVSSVYWKPQIEWVPLEITTVKSGELDNCYINELSLTPTTSNSEHFFAMDRKTNNRCQVNITFLRDVEYVIKVTPYIHKFKEGMASSPEGYLAQLIRRLERGTYFKKPYLGRSEFPCQTTLCKESPKRNPFLNFDIPALFNGMVYDKKTGIATPSFFDAKIVEGRLDVPFLLCDNYGVS